MKSAHLVDPELRAVLEQIPHMDFSVDILPIARATPVQFPLDPSVAVQVDTRRVSIPGPSGSPAVGLTVYRPKDTAEELPCIYHIHGGGYVMGSAEQYQSLVMPQCLELRCVIISVDYRLAPETQFPGSIEDCYVGLEWTFAHASELQIDATRIGVMGESAGGGLAASLALLARDRDGNSLAFQHLIYPMLDDRTPDCADPHPYTGEYIWTGLSNRFGWGALLGKARGTAAVSPYAAAARATDLSRLPNTYIAAGALDLFLEEDLEYARRLTRHGVSVELHVYPGAYHGFDMLTQSTVANVAKRDSLAALKRALAT
jgi:triacylglycerol lipase